MVVLPLNNKKCKINFPPLLPNVQNRMAYLMSQALPACHSVKNGTEMKVSMVP